jgi:hypothetical protein
VRSAGEPTFVRQRTALRSLVDGWDDMTADQRKRLLGTIFEEITVGAHGVSELAPREGWRPYMKATLTAPRDFLSGRRDSNPRPSPWQGDALPLRHFRKSLSADRDYIVSVAFVPAPCA